MEHIDLGPNLHLEVLPLLLSEETPYTLLSATARGNYYLVQGPKSIKSSLRGDIEVQQLKEIGRYYRNYAFSLSC